MKIDKLIVKEKLDELPVLFRTLTLKSSINVKKTNPNLSGKEIHIFYKTIILPFKF